MGVFELVGSHYINLALHLFGPIRGGGCIYFDWNASGNQVLSPDTVIVTANFAGGVAVHFHFSYAGPFFNRVFLIGTEGYFEYDGSQYRICYPRDSFGPGGRFISPPCVSFERLDQQDNWTKSLENSLRDFIEVVKTRGAFSTLDFELALNSMEPIFSLRRTLKGGNQ